MSVEAEDWHQYAVGDRVQTIDGYPGVVTGVMDGPFGIERYAIVLDQGLGGGDYGPGDIVGKLNGGPNGRMGSKTAAADPRRKAYDNGWAAWQRGSWDAVGKADARRVPKEWYLGFFDADSGNEKYYSLDNPDSPMYSPSTAARTGAREDRPLLEPDEAIAAGYNLASTDYPELTDILYERPDWVEVEPASDTLRLGKTATKVAVEGDEIKVDPFHFKPGDIYEGVHTVDHVEPVPGDGRSFTVVLIDPDGNEWRTRLFGRKKFTIIRPKQAKVAEWSGKDDLRWSEPDGSIKWAVAHAVGRAFDDWTVYDAVGLTWGDAAETMRSALKAGTPRFEVEGPNGERKGYVTLAAARKAIEREADQRYFAPRREAKQAMPAIDPVWNRKKLDPIGESLTDPDQPGWWRKIVGPALDRMNRTRPPKDQITDLNAIPALQWCRFRRDGYCFFPDHLDAEGTKEAGYAVWIPKNQGICPRRSHKAQKECPVSEPGPDSGEKTVYPDATISWREGGQRQNRSYAMAVPVELTHKQAMPNLRDFQLGQRVTVKNHPDEPGTIVSVPGQGAAYRKGYVEIAFDDAPDKPVQYPYREVQIISESRRYSDVPLACDGCGSAAVTSIAGGKEGHTMLCPDCLDKRENKTAGARLTDARAVSNALRAAGFSASKSSGTRIRGAPNVTSGFQARKYNPLRTKDWVINVTWVNDWQAASRGDTFRAPDPDQKLVEMADALRAAGFTVVRPNEFVPTGQTEPDKYAPGSGLYVWTEANWGSKQAASEHAIDGWDTSRNTVMVSCKCGWTHTERKDWDAKGARAKCRTAYQEHKGGAGKTAKIAKWADLVVKAKHIYREGGVRVISVTPLVETGKPWYKGEEVGTVTAEVLGDHSIYQSSITREPGSKRVGMWECSCPWASYSWARTRQWKKYEGRMCSHVLALMYEAQAQEMFGDYLGLQEDDGVPEWRTHDPTFYTPPDRVAAKTGAFHDVVVKIRNQIVHLLDILSPAEAVVEQFGEVPVEDILYPTTGDLNQGLHYIELDRVAKQAAGHDPAENITGFDRMSRCYELAGRYLIENKGTLVHGIVHSGAQEIRHAWVIDQDGEIFEPTTGIHYDAASFERQYQPIERVRYPWDKAAVQMLRFKHWGPWDDEPDFKAAKVAVQHDGDERPYGNYTMRYSTSDQGERRPRHIIETYDGPNKVGELNWYGTTGKVHHIDVEPEHARRGIATAMWEWGKEMRPRPRHDPSNQTTQGKEWAKSVGASIEHQAIDDDPEWWLDKQTDNSDPNDATISAAPPEDVAAPKETDNYEPWSPLSWAIGDYRPKESALAERSRTAAERQTAADEPKTSIMYDEPQPALPVSYGSEEDDAALLEPGSVPDDPDPLVPGDARLAWVMGDHTAVSTDDEGDVAGAAEAFLAKQGLKNFSPQEKAEIIDEGGDAGAANLGSLDLSGTHYTWDDNDDDSLMWAL
jgi:hypothetical protein